jgi:DNA polymerase-3 subunit delta
MRLGIFQKEQAEIAQQYARWTRPERPGAAALKLDRLVPRLVALHRALVTNSQSAQLLLAHDLAQITRFAARR